MPKPDVKFIATYESGHQEWLWIDAKEARAGDHVAARIARLQQQQGDLPECNILSVRRTDRD